MYEIRYPNERTYFISFNDERTVCEGYGIVETNQVMKSKWIFDSFIDKAEWLAELANWGIIPEFDEQGNIVM
jgi:hypothetical protein